MKIYEIKHEYRLHTVCLGETLARIAEKYGTTAANIQKYNKMPSALCAGDMLYIGGLDRNLYIVRPLDTLESIAAKFNTDSMKIRLLNDINSIYIGQRILI